MTKPLKEDFIIRIKSRIDQPAEPEGKPEYVELMTRGSLTRRGDSYYITYRETETTGYEGCVTTLKLAENGSRVALLRFGQANTQLLIEKGRRNLCHYETGYGSVTLGVTADELHCDLTEEGRSCTVQLSAGCRQRRAGQPQPAGSHRDRSEQDPERRMNYKNHRVFLTRKDAKDHD